MRGVRWKWAARVRFLVTIFVLLCSVLPARDAQSAPALERGAAITDPLALRVEPDFGSATADFVTAGGRE